MFRRRPSQPSATGNGRGPGRPGGVGDREGTVRAHESRDDMLRGSGKGRPTPKRREAERQRRKRVRSPRDRKEAHRQARARAKEERSRMRRGLSSGDERNLPPRDAGPVKAFARDFVDSRRRAGELFLPGAILVFGLNFYPDPRVKSLGLLLWLLLILFVVFDSFRTVVGAKREVARRFPKESTRGVGMYVVMRGMQIRRLRLPPPRVKPGKKRV